MQSNFEVAFCDGLDKPTIMIFIDCSINHSIIKVPKNFLVKFGETTIDYFVLSFSLPIREFTIEDATQDGDCWRSSTSAVRQRSEFSTKSSYEIEPK